MTETVDACIIAALETKLAEAEELYKKRYDWAMHERDVAQQRAEQAEARLAKVPALTRALRRIERGAHANPAEALANEARKALTEYEAETPPT